MSTKVVVNTLSTSGTYIDLQSKTSASTTGVNAVEFEFQGAEFTIKHAKLGYGDASTANINVYVNDVLFTTFNVYAESGSFGHSSLITGLPLGRNKIKIVNETTIVGLSARLEAITAVRKINVINQGYSGTNTGQWVTSNWITERVSPESGYVFVQLGTNDRQNTKKIGTFKKYYTDLLDQILAVNPKANIIIMSPPAVTQNEDPVETVYQFRISDLNYALQKIAKLRNYSFISNFEATSKLKAKGEVFLSDGLHPNDYGYSVIADHIINQILNA